MTFLGILFRERENSEYHKKKNQDQNSSVV